MPVPTVMGDLSVTESSNSPSGSDPISTSLDNYLRAIQSILRSTNHKGPDIASAASVAIGASAGEFLTITGTTTITSFDSVSAGINRVVHFSGALTLTHSTNIQLPGSVNYTTTAGDVLVFRSLGSGQWKCVSILQSIPQSIKKIKATTTSRSSSTSLTDDPDLFADLSTGSYLIELNILHGVGPGGTADLNFQVTFSGTFDNTDTSTTTYLLAWTNGNAADTTVNTLAVGSSTTANTGAHSLLTVRGILRVSAAGTLKFRWAQSTSQVTAVHVLYGSNLQLTKLT